MRAPAGEICRRAGYPLLDLPVNLGLSGAFRTGMRYAWEKGYDAAVQIDADGQHDPNYIEPMIRVMEETGADVSICGVRYGVAVPAEDGKREVWSGEEALTALLDRKINNGVWNKLYRRRLFRDVVFPEALSKQQKREPLPR